MRVKDRVVAVSAIVCICLASASGCRSEQVSEDKAAVPPQSTSTTAAASAGDAALPVFDIGEGFRAEGPVIEASMPSLEFAAPSPGVTGSELEVGTVLPEDDYQVFLSGSHVTAVQWVESTDADGDIELWLKLDEKGAAVFSEWTGANVMKDMLLLLDGKLLRYPLTVAERIPDGTVRLSTRNDRPMREALESAIVSAR